MEPVGECKQKRPPLPKAIKTNNAQVGLSAFEMEKVRKAQTQLTRDCSLWSRFCNITHRTETKIEPDP